MRFLCCFYVGQKFTYKITFSKIYLVPSKLLIYIKFRQKVNLLVSETQGAVQTVTDGTVGESPRSGSTRRRARRQRHRVLQVLQGPGTMTPGVNGMTGMDTAGTSGKTRMKRVMSSRGRMKTI